MRTSFALAFVCYWLNACASNDANRVPPERPANYEIPRDATPLQIESDLDRATQLSIRALAAESQRIRQLMFVRGLRIEALSPDMIRDALWKKQNPEDIARAERVYRALGLLPKKQKLEDIIRELVAEQVIGYYDPESAQLVLRIDISERLRNLDSSGEPAQITLIHELIHALQDQHFVLHEERGNRTTDEDNAYRCLIEGDATMSMLKAAPKFPSSENIGSDRLFQEQQQSVFARAPLIVQRSLLAPYTEGFHFVKQIYDRGGWPAVNGIYAALPTSTAEILHPELWLTGEKPLKVRWPTPGFAAQGWRQIEDDTLGEMEMQVFLGLDKRRLAQDAAKGWQADRLRVYDQRGQTAFAWWTVWQTRRDATQAAEAAQRAIAHLGGGQVEHNGRRMLWTHGFDEQSQTILKQRFDTWTPNLHN